MPREVTFQLPDGLQPVRGRLLRDQLDVQETASGHVRVAGTNGASRGPDARAIGSRARSQAVAAQAHDARRHVGHQVLVQAERLGDGERPPGLERAADHRGAGSGRRRGQPERVQKPEPAHPDRQVHVVDGRPEPGEHR